MSHISTPPAAVATVDDRLNALYLAGDIEVAAITGVRWTPRRMAGHTWVDTVVEDASDASQIAFRSLVRPAAPSRAYTLEAFVQMKHLGTVLGAAEALAHQAATGAQVRVRRALRSDPELGGLFVELDAEVYGMPRDAFRTAQREFYSRLNTLPDANRLGNVVISFSRGA